jgi:hypothetical protein
MFKGKTARAVRDVDHRSSEVFVTHQDKSWMDESLMLRWVKDVLLKHTEGKHCLLVLVNDAFRAHITDADRLWQIRGCKGHLVVLTGMQLNRHA